VLIDRKIAATPWRTRKLAKLKSRSAYVLCCAFALFALVLLALVIGHLISMGASGMSWALLTQPPTGDPQHPGGMLPALAGTAVLIGLASLVGVPLGLLAGVYLSEYRSRSRLATSVRFIADVLASVPSIVVGILGYELLVVPMGRFNGWAGAAALAFIMIPIVTRTTEEMLLLVPSSLREGALALGGTRARAMFTVMLPAALPGVITGILVAIARIAGETAPLLFTAFNNRFFSTSLGQPISSLTVQVFTYAISPYEDWHRQAWAGALVLVALVLLCSILARFATRRLERLQTGQ